MNDAHNKKFVDEKNNILELKDIKVCVADREIIKGFDLEIKKGQIVVIMGPNGSGKSTLANALMGHPSYVASGRILLENEDLIDAKPDERSRKGLFLSFQYPSEIPGVTVANFLRAAMNARRDKDNQIKLLDFMKSINSNMDLLHIPREFASRYLNEGFSGGEKKKMEILQLAMLEPKVAILDETDSGLDIDALKRVCEGINAIKKKLPELTLIIITHYQRMLNYISPDKVCILVNGKIVKCGGAELAESLEKEGYEAHK